MSENKKSANTEYAVTISQTLIPFQLIKCYNRLD